MAVGSGFLWAVDSGQDVIRRIDASTKRVSGALRAGADPVAVAATHDALWVATRATTPFPGSTSGGHGRQAISVGDAPAAIAVGGVAVWVANAGEGSVTRIDQRTNRVTATIAVGPRPQGIVVAGGSVWVTVRS
jgi:YVTN family beta-propeller protein